MRLGDTVFFNALSDTKTLAPDQMACQREKKHIAN